MARVSIRDVADLAGVSISTASKALNRNGRISEETMKRVTEASRKLGYVANAAGQSLSRRNKTIGIIIPENPLEVMRCFQYGFQQAMSQYERFGIQFVLKTYDMFSEEPPFPPLLQELEPIVNGLIVIPSQDYSACLEKMQTFASKIPVVTLLTPMESFQGLATVMVNARVVGKMAAEYIGSISQARQLAIISGNRSGIIHQQNIEGFCDTAAAMGREVVFISDSGNKMDAAYCQTEKLLQTVPDTGGIFVTSYVAPGVCRALIDHGVQDKIAVIGVDLYRETAELLKSGALNAVIFQNQVQQAYTAVRMLAEHLTQRRETKAAIIKPELVLKSNLECYDWEYIYKGEEYHA